jgi:hypothetical protein
VVAANFSGTLEAAVSRQQILRDILRVAAHFGVVQWSRASEAIDAGDASCTHILRLLIAKALK